MNVISIRRDTLVSKADQEAVDLAYNRWLARGFRGGSPEEDLLNALRIVKGNTSAGLFPVPKRNLMGRVLHPFDAIRSHLRAGPQ